jgi:hypothetical protein
MIKFTLYSHIKADFVVYYYMNVMAVFTVRKYDDMLYGG